MPDDATKSKLRQFAEVLSRHGVEFIVIGGQAEILMGGARPTFDVDLCYRRTRENLERLAKALRELRPTLRGAPADLPFQIDAVSLSLGNNYTFTTMLGDLDLLGFVEPLGGYEELAAHSTRERLGDVDVTVISLDDLIRIKRHINRPKDRESLFQLEAIKRIRAEGDTV